MIVLGVLGFFRFYTDNDEWNAIINLLFACTVTPTICMFPCTEHITITKLECLVHYCCYCIGKRFYHNKHNCTTFTQKTFTNRQLLWRQSSSKNEKNTDFRTEWIKHRSQSSKLLTIVILIIIINCAHLRYDFRNRSQSHWHQKHYRYSRKRTTCQSSVNQPIIFRTSKHATSPM